MATAAPDIKKIEFNEEERRFCPQQHGDFKMGGLKCWVWQQDSAHCHISSRSLKWLCEHCYVFIG
uniref:Uncharacterized protein n=1 Tax=Lepeophtheirus salmonis TaxID=72036 RepID=A0A0K2UY25_LEPSM